MDTRLMEVVLRRGNRWWIEGSRFDIKAFNDTVVLGGNVPQDVLAKYVDEYIRMAKA
jgi:uncharacterized protein (DUF885 family)